MRRRVPTLLSLLAALALAIPAAAAAKTGRCLGGHSGPRCHFQMAKVSRFKDGDTIQVDLSGDRTRRTYAVRVIGIQAMEQSVYSSKHPERRRGQCHALEATARFEALVKAGHRRLRLAAQHPSRDSRGRLMRSVAVRIKGRWRDVGETLMSEGHTLWLPASEETAWNQRYNRAAQQAARKHIGLWNTTHCGSGPSQTVPLRLWVSWDPVSSDVEHLNGEWIKVQNRSSTQSIPLGGWWLRDSMLRRFTFPKGTTLAPGATATLYAGHGSRSGNSFHWGLPSPPFQNPGDSRHLGDGGYLFDPKGDLRAWMLYPCVVSCTSPDQGAVRVSSHPDAPEYATFRNVSNRPVDLYGYAMAIPGSTYPFGPRSVLAPSQSLRVYIGGDPHDDTATARHWGLDGYMLPDAGGSVRLETFSDISLGCEAWGYGHC